MKNNTKDSILWILSFVLCERVGGCAPARTRTWNDGSEDRCDIHFTTSAFV